MKSILSVFLILLLVSSCKKPEAFVYKDIKNIKVKNLSLDSSNISMNIVFYNPNNYGVNLKNVDCKIFVDSNYVGRFLLDTLMRIDKKADFELPVDLKVDLKTVMKNSLTMLFSNEVLIGANGTSRVGKGGFFVTVPFSYGGRHKLKLF